MQFKAVDMYLVGRPDQIDARHNPRFSNYGLMTEGTARKTAESLNRSEPAHRDLDEIPDVHRWRLYRISSIEEVIDDESMG